MNQIIKIVPHKDFTKQLKKQPKKIRNKVRERMSFFMDDPFDPILRNHALTGKWKGFRSINITGDIRAVYQLIDDNTAVFVALGAHSQLYR